MIAAAAAGLALTLAAGTGTVRVHLANELTRVYREGYVWFVALDGGAPRKVATANATIRIAAGQHRLRVYIRPCDGNCSVLDPPAHRCSRIVRGGDRVTYHLRDGGCALTVAR